MECMSVGLNSNNVARSIRSLQYDSWNLGHEFMPDEISAQMAKKK